MLKNLNFFNVKDSFKYNFQLTVKNKHRRTVFFYLTLFVIRSKNIILKRYNYTVMFLRKYSIYPLLKLTKKGLTHFGFAKGVKVIPENLKVFNSIVYTVIKLLQFGFLFLSAIGRGFFLEALKFCNIQSDSNQLLLGNFSTP